MPHRPISTCKINGYGYTIAGLSGRDWMSRFRPMSLHQELDRLELAREHRGLTQESLAKALNVSRRTLNNWTNGIPSNRLTRIAEVLDVDERWIASGENPPTWYLAKIMLTGGIRSEDLTSEKIRALCSEWWYVFEGVFLERLMGEDLSLRIPAHLRVKRWEFITDRRGSLLSQLSAQEVQETATQFHVWPTQPELSSAILSEISFPSRSSISDGQIAEDPLRWQDLLRRIEADVKGYRSAIRDRSRRARRQSEVWKLLTTQQRNEPLLSGRAVVPVLGACLRAARATGILFSSGDMLEQVVEKILVSDFQGKSFSLRDMGEKIRRYRGLRLIGRGAVTLAERRRRAIQANVVSEDTVVRILSKIAGSGFLPLTRKPKGHIWSMGNVMKT